MNTFFVEVEPGRLVNVSQIAEVTRCGEYTYITRIDDAMDYSIIEPSGEVWNRLKMLSPPNEK